MTKRIFVFAGVLALALCISGVAQAGNVLWNSSFELNDGPTATPTYWAAPDRGGGTAALSTEQAHSGLQSMKLAGGNPNSIKQDNATAGQPATAFDLDPAKSYQRSLWVYATTVPNGTIDIFFSTGLDAGYDTKTITVQAEANQWVYVVDPVLITGKSHLGMFGVRSTNTAITPVYFDDVAFSEVVPEPATIAGLLTGTLGMLGFAIRRRK